MRRVDFRIDSSVVLHIRWLRGSLQPTAPASPPYFDDPSSFTLAIDSAEIGISPASLAGLLNHYVFAYPGSPLRELTIRIEQGRLVQEGKLRGVSFTTVADVSLTPEGEIRLHPDKIKAAGLSVGGLMKFFGLQLQKLVNLKRARGIRIEGNDFLLQPTHLLPPPTIDGRLISVEVKDTEVVQVFAPGKAGPAKGLTLPQPKVDNYMYFRGGTLKFGRLTMTDADLEIIDAEPADPFDFFLSRYNAQLVAGYSRSTADHGLIVWMPDSQRAADVTAHGGLVPEPRTTRGQ